MSSVLNRGVRKLQRAMAHAFMPDPRKSDGGQLSMIYPDDGGNPSARLLDLLAQVIPVAARQDPTELSRRIVAGPKWPDVWPGEHYKLLMALVKVLAPKRVIEIGTYQGLGSLALAANLPLGGTLHTYDVVPFSEVPGNTLCAADLADGRLVQVIDDVTWPDGFERHRTRFEDADLIFIDAEKDGRMETRLIALLERVRFVRNPIVVFDDIRLWNMLEPWHALKRPKLDATSVGHWSGTGIVDWCG